MVANRCGFLSWLGRVRNFDDDFFAKTVGRAQNTPSTLPAVTLTRRDAARLVYYEKLTDLKLDERTPEVLHPRLL